MSFAEAREIVLFEAYADEGVLICVRQGSDPGAQRMARLISALRSIYGEMTGRDSIERKLAAALCALRAYVCERVLGERPSSAWRGDFAAVEVHRLGACIESIFEGQRIEWV